MNMKYLSIYLVLFINGLFLSLSSANNDTIVTDRYDHDQFTIELVTENLYVIHGLNEQPNASNKGFINNPGVIITKSGVVVIDPGSSNLIGEIIVKRISQITELPIIAIFNTHEHGDHWLANQAIIEKYPNIPVYAHADMITSINQGTGKHWLSLMRQLTEDPLVNTHIYAPTHPVKNNDEIIFDNLTFKIHHYGVSHTNNDIMIEVVELDTIFLGDNVLNNRMPHLDDGDIVGNISAIKEVLKLEFIHYIPGHGPSGHNSIPEDYLAYLTQLHQLVSDYYQQDMSDFEMKEPIMASMTKFSSWVGFEEELGKHISLVYLQVERDDF
jgi:glyoxylase-like metal-dependent hydrolase (beta-lactamase superfamily II)